MAKGRVCVWHRLVQLSRPRNDFESVEMGEQQAEASSFERPVQKDSLDGCLLKPKTAESGNAKSLIRRRPCRCAQMALVRSRGL